MLDIVKNVINKKISLPYQILSLRLVLSYHYLTRVNCPPPERASIAAVFGFMIMGYYFIATAMVFGAVISATSWEPFRRAIETMTHVYSLCTDLADKHKHYLDMISLKPLPPEDTEYVKAIPDSLNPLVVDEEGRQKPIPNFIYVDDCLIKMGANHVTITISIDIGNIDSNGFINLTLC